MQSKQRQKPRREKVPKLDIQASRFAFEQSQKLSRVLKVYVCTDHCASRYSKVQPSSILYIPMAILPAVRLWALGDHNDLNMRCYRGPVPLFILRARHIPGYRLSLNLCGPWDDICAARKMRGQEDEYHTCIQLSSTKYRYGW